MLSPEQNLTEKSLKANFTEVQQVHFDRLMAELEQISGGLGFAELKKKAEDGNKEALQVMRDYIAKKEEIVEFIENKEVPEEESELDWECDIEVGDDVMIWKPESVLHGGVFPVSAVDTEDERIELEIGSGTSRSISKKDVIKVQATRHMPSGDVVHDFDLKSIYGLKLLEKYMIDQKNFNIQDVLDTGARRDFEKHEVKTAKILKVFFNSNLSLKLSALVHFDLNTATGGSINFACSYDIEKLKEAIKK